MRSAGADGTTKLLYLNGIEVARADFPVQNTLLYNAVSVPVTIGADLASNCWT